MGALELRIPPLVLVAAAALGMWLLAAYVPAASFHARGQGVAAIAIAALGLFFCAAGVLEFRHAQTTTNPMQPAATSALVARGVYRFSRNPMYLGFAAVLLGWAVFLGNPLSLLVLAGFIGYLTRFQITPEERTLVNLFGAEFVAYCGKVRRWI